MLFRSQWLPPLLTTRTDDEPYDGQQLIVGSAAGVREFLIDGAEQLSFGHSHGLITQFQYGLLRHCQVLSIQKHDNAHGSGEGRITTTAGADGTHAIERIAIDA